MFKKFILVCGAVFFTSNQLFYSAGTVGAEDMAIESKIGQMMCLDFRFWNDRDLNQTEELGITAEDSAVSTQNPVIEINSEIKEIIARYHIGSVILFSQNFQNKEQAKKLINDLQKAAIDSGNSPLLICVDQEGGRVERFSFGRDRLKNNVEIRTPEEAFEKGKIIAEELAELGINCNFAPVVDINSNPKNPVINVRSFGDNPKIVSEHGVAFMNGLHSQNIIATAKHFPGHGDTDVDSHLGLPRVNKTLSDLEQFELKPFKSCIDAGLEMVMTAHIELPQVEKGTIISKKDGKKIFLPATLSKSILTGLLRDRLKFNGVIVTDAMNMKAISENVGEVEATRMAIKAGADMICMPVTLRSTSDISKLDAIYQDLKSAVDSGEISLEQINCSVIRILGLKNKQIKLH